MKLKLQNKWLSLGAIVTSTLISTNSYAAPATATGATTDLTRVTNTLSGNVNSLLQIASVGSYAAAAFIGIGGVMKLKAHAENPGQTPVSHGIGRLAAAGGLSILPFAIQTSLSSLTGDDSGSNSMKSNFGGGTARL